MDAVVEDEPDGFHEEVPEEEETADEHDQSEGRGRLAAGFDGASGNGSPPGTGAGEKEGDDQPDCVPEEGPCAFSVVENPAEDHGYQGKEGSGSSEDEGELGVSDFVLDVARLSCEEVLSFQLVEIVDFIVIKIAWKSHV